jgi:hypothetical protein
MFSCAASDISLSDNLLLIWHTDRPWLDRNTVSINELGSIGARTARFGM